MMHRRRRFLLLAIVPVGAAAIVAASCTTFNFPYPADAAPGDAAVEACSADAATGGGYLSVDQAVHLCTLVATCLDLDVSISASIALPLDQTGGSYAACVNWLAGSATADRTEFATQAQMLINMAGATSCDEAFSYAFVYPIDAGYSSAEDCLDGGAGIVRGIAGVEFESPCTAPIWAGGGSCFIDTSVLGVRSAHCGTRVSNCTVGLACSGTTLSVCSGGDAGELWSINCGVFGEVCASLDCNSPLGPVCGIGDRGATCTTDSRAIRYCNGQPQIRSTFDCSASGRLCELADAALAVPYCRGPCDTCTPFDPGMGRCADDGGAITLCIDGVPSSYPCACVLDPYGGHCQ